MNKEPFFDLQAGPIGVFDSGFGGLTVLRSLVRALPKNDFLYLGDNARAPYGMRSFDTIYHYTRECVEYLFSKGCPLVILACNTASAKALRNIQQLDLPNIAPQRRVLGVIRPTTEIIGAYTKTKHIGILGTKGTVKSESYRIEIQKFFPQLQVYQHACPMWVPLVENDEHNSIGADYFIQKDLNALLQMSPQLDTILLGCTHYPLLMPTIKKFLPRRMQVIQQGPIIAKSLVDYLNRHPKMNQYCTQTGQIEFQTTGDAHEFERQGKLFYGTQLMTSSINLTS